MIEAKSITKKFKKFVAVDSISFEPRKGEIFGLLGLNGAGKTTTQRIISTVFRPTSGEALVNGFSITNEASKVRKSIGFVPTEVGLYDRLTGREVVRYFGRLNDMEGRDLEERIDTVIGILSLGEYADRKCGQLSRGNKQKVAIARAIVHDPPVFLFDEPTSGLDVLAARGVIDFMKKSRDDGKTTLYSTHVMSEAEEICDKIGVIHDGRLLYTGGLKEFIEGKRGLEEAFTDALRMNAK